jgi:hypothetical protein
MITEFI